MSRRKRLWGMSEEWELYIKYLDKYNQWNYCNGLKGSEKEVFTSRTVSLEEVKKNLKEWIPSPQAESQSLLSHEAIRPISHREYMRTMR